ncbi:MULTISPECIES: Sec-independent protein translocase protein TatB [unclassified Pantoea]|uniref:Sec-independent protein translocase protein TatB n=1 Tax=unclassified Pantoea TaxID=2630326 RepID=UPI001CD2C7FE|nr:MULTISPECIES: Sec-independent protein translocase protein TatB [unclassified Pantoea]MCA1178597.1 Sec-independent protein translocase protein TatB [Pantoea sp. alder69]MCA1253452.1 Sec-independent protein translocase protein TatB [Pantoea sp. alder70]MCA1266865.1 Sec-independent protein translocase protein TatB [Pantoea sp. alder81]
MFDIGFSELVLVFVIGLIVLGPQRLPVAVKTVVGWIRAIRSLAANVQNELAQELKLQELQDSLKKVEEAGRGSLSPELKESMEELRKTADSMKRSVQQSIDIEKAEDEANTIHQSQPAETPSAPVSQPPVTTAAAEHQASSPTQAPQPVAADHQSSSQAQASQPAAAQHQASAPAQAPQPVAAQHQASAPAQAPQPVTAEAAAPVNTAQNATPTPTVKDER